MKNYNSTILILLTLLFSLLAIGSFSKEWGEYQNDETNTGFAHDGTAHFTSSLGTTYTRSEGMSYQPLIVNITGSTNLETIIYSGSFLQLYNTQMGLIDESNIGAIQGQPIIYNNGTVNIAVAIADDVIEAWTYNGSGFIDKFANDTQLNQTFVCDVWTGIKCTNDHCYTLCDNSTDTFIYAINMTSATWLSAQLSPNHAKEVPSIDDFDRDGRKEIVWDCDADGNGDYGICVADLNNSKTPYLDTGFSTDGIIDDIENDGGEITSPVIYNIDGAGDKEVIVAYGDSPNIKTFKSDGSVLWTATWSISTNSILQAVLVDNDVGNFDVCTGGLSSVTDYIHLLCVDFEGNKIVENIISSGWVNNGITGSPIVSADMTGDGVDELVFSGGITNASGTIITNTTSNNVFYVSVVDVNVDGELDIVQTNGSETKIIYSSFDNTNPELNDSYRFSGFGNSVGYGSVICKGDNITYTAQQVGTSQVGNYENDASEDTERIKADCFLNNTLINGVYHASRPTVQCNYDTAGVFETRLYINDQANPDNITEFNVNNIIVNVVDGIRGITCGVITPVDVGGTVVTGGTDATAGQNDALLTWLDPLTGTGAGSNLLKMIVAIIMIMFLMGAFAVQTGIQNPIVIVFVGIMATVIFTLMGMIPAFVLVLLLVTAIVVLLIGRFLLTPQAGGE